MRNGYPYAPRGFDSQGNPVGGYADPDTYMSDRSVDYLTGRVERLAGAMLGDHEVDVYRTVAEIQATIEADAYNPNSRKQIDEYVEDWHRALVGRPKRDRS